MTWLNRKIRPREVLNKVNFLWHLRKRVRGYDGSTAAAYLRSLCDTKRQA
jgi:hypothetical protein